MNKSTKIRIDIAACIVVLIVAFFLRSVSMHDRITKGLGASDYDVVCIEEMVDHDMAVADITKPEDKEAVIAALKEAEARFVKLESGMKMESALYTLTVASDAGSMSLTVDQSNRVHINTAEKTYAVTNGSDLYRTLQQIFNHYR